jgi:hypothetical protein
MKHKKKLSAALMRAREHAASNHPPTNHPIQAPNAAVEAQFTGGGSGSVQADAEVSCVYFLSSAFHRTITGSRCIRFYTFNGRNKAHKASEALSQFS